MFPLQGRHLTASLAGAICVLCLIPAYRTSFPFLSPPESQSAPAGCEIPPEAQTLTLAWSKSTTQTHRVAKVSASVLAVHQGGPLLQQSQTSRAAKAGEGHLWEDACASGSSLPCGRRLRGTTA